MREQNKYTGPDAEPDDCGEAAGAPTGRPATTTALTRGIRRFLVACGGATVTELRLASGRRADIACIDARGIVTIVEIKSGPEDLKADSKWQTYLDYCDRFYFGVSPSFPLTLLPDDAGIILADAYEAVVHRDCTPSPLASARRKAMMIRFAQTAATRLMRVEDPTDPTTGSLADAIPSIPSRL